MHFGSLDNEGQANYPSWKKYWNVTEFYEFPCQILVTLGDVENLVGYYNFLRIVSANAAKKRVLIIDPDSEPLL